MKTPGAYAAPGVFYFGARIGMNQSLLAQYIKGNKKPSPKQTKRIMEGVRTLGRELADIEFLM